MQSKVQTQSFAIPNAALIRGKRLHPFSLLDEWNFANRKLRTSFPPLRLTKCQPMCSTSIAVLFLAQNANPVCTVRKQPHPHRPPQPHTNPPSSSSSKRKTGKVSTHAQSGFTPILPPPSKKIHHPSGCARRPTMPARIILELPLIRPDLLSRIHTPSTRLPVQSLGISHRIPSRA